MRKSVCLLMLGLLIISCSKEEVGVDTVVENNSYSKNLDFNSLGNYQGTYVATGTSERGQVNVTLTETGAKASIQLASGKELKFTSDKVSFTSMTAQSTLFTGTAGSFEFSVAADGSEPKVTNVNLNSIIGNIILAKATTTTNVRSITGTYGCETCDEHPLFSNPDMQESLVWNLTLQGDASGLEIVTAQVSAGSKTFVMEAAQADPYTVLGDMIYSNINGEFAFGEMGLVSWTGEYMFNDKQACESVNGSWTFSSAHYSFDGWIKSDTECDVTGTGDLPYCNAAETKVSICHNGNTICVSVNAMEAHLAHGDVLGSCD